MPAQTLTPQPGAMKAHDLRRWASNGCKPNDGIKARNKARTDTSATRVSPAAQLTPEQLGTKAAYAHELVVKFPKRSTARKAAKRFIELFGPNAFDTKLTEVSVDAEIAIAKQVQDELGSTLEVLEGINAALAALVKTYTGPKPV